MLQRLTVLIDADVQRFAAAINSVNGGLNGLARQAQQVGQTLSLAISAPLALLEKRAVDTYAEMDSLRRGLATLEKDAGSLTKRMADLNEVAKLPGLGLQEAYQFDIALRSAGFSADLSKRSMMAFGNALAIVGKGKDQLKGLSVQLQQLAGKTGGFSQDLRIIKDYAPQVSTAMQAAFGTSNTDAINKMGITGKEVIERIIVELAKLPAATGGPKNAFENFGDVVTRTLDSIGSLVYNGLGLAGFFNGLADGLTKLQTKLTNLPSTTQGVVATFGLLAIGIPPIIAGLGFLYTTILPALKAGMIATRAAATLMLGPIGLIAAAVAAAAVLIIMHWDRIKEALVSTGVWTQLKDLVKSGLGVVTSIFGVFANLFQGDWANLWNHVVNLGKYAWNALVSVVGAGILAMGGLIAKGLSVFGLDSWAKRVDEEMGRVQERIAGKKFAIDAPMFNPFAGFQFGGPNVKDGSNGTGGGNGDGKKQKSVEDPTRLEVLERIKKNIEQEMQDIRAAGELVSDDLSHQLEHTIYQIARLKNEVQRNDFKPNQSLITENIKSQTDRIGRYMDGMREKLQQFTSGGFIGLLSDQLGKLNAIVQNLTLNKLAIPKEVTDSIYAYSKQLSNVNALSERATLTTTITASQADGGWSNAMAVAAKIQNAAIANFNRNRERVILSAKDMATAVTQTLQAGAGAAAEAMAGFIGGLIAGTQGIQDLPKVILSVFADMLQSLATALAASAAVMLFVPGLQAQAAAQFAGAAGLFAVSGLARGLAQPKKMANGGYAQGATYSLTGEYSGANLHRNGEFVAPVRKGARLLVEEMAAQGGMGGGGGGELTARVSGGDLEFVLTRYQRSQKTYGKRG